MPLICPDNNSSLSIRANIEGIESIHDLIAGAGPPSAQINETTIQNMLSDAFYAYKNYESRGNLRSLERAISKFEAIAKRTPENDTRAPLVLSNLGSCLLRRFEELGSVVDMNKGMEQLEKAVDLTPDGDPDKTILLSNLGSCFLARFERLGNPGDIDAAITRHQSAVNLATDDHPNKPAYLNNLGSSLETRFERLGNLDDMDGAITQKQAALNLTPDGHHYKPNYLSSLGSSLDARFERLGDLDDIDTAITLQQAAIGLTPEGHPEKPHRLSILGSSLRTRFKRLGKLEDINTAITQQQEAVHLTPDNHVSKPTYMANLGNSLLVRFEWLGNLDDIDYAVTQHQEAVHFSPDGHPSKPQYLDNLGNSLQIRFGRLRKLEDIDTAINRQQEAINLTPDDDIGKATYLNNLGTSFWNRFYWLGNLADIDAAINQHQAAVNLIPDGHPVKPTFSGNLGTSYRRRFIHLRHLKDAEIAISQFSTSAQSSLGSPTIRFKHVRQWIEVASLIRHKSLLDAYECALNLMPLVAWLGLPIAVRHEHLVQMGGIARDAAAAAISLEEYDKAVEWLEQGRSIVWNQILQLRNPVDELRSVNSDLADHLVRVSRLIDRGVEDNSGMRPTEEKERQYRAWIKEWESIIKQVRSLPTFEDFLKPRKISTLMDASRDGPVVLLNITEERCDALALVAGFDEVIHIPLPNVTSTSVMKLQEELKNLLYHNSIRLRGDRAAKKWTEEGSNDCKGILAELWTGLVKPVLDSLAFSVRILLISTFNLLIAFLPALSGYTSTYMVVSNRTPRIPPDPRSWNIRVRLFGLTNKQLCNFIIYPYHIRSTRIIGPCYELGIQATFSHTTVGSWCDLNPKYEARA
jgi:tetratricopeptide (TPR) repeat protein